MSPEVLIYINNIKKIFSVDLKMREYFIRFGEEELFFEKLKEVSQKKFKSKGQPELTKEEFETLRQDIQNSKIFFNLGALGMVCLN